MSGVNELDIIYDKVSSDSSILFTVKIHNLHFCRDSMPDFPIIWDFSSLRSFDNTSLQFNNLSKSESVCIQIVYIIMCFVGTIGNLITIIALVRDPELRKRSNTKFVVSLAISDLLFCFIIMPIWIVIVSDPNIILFETICSFSTYSGGATQATSLITLMAIAINRYVMICHKSIYQYVYTPLSVSLMITFIWLFTFGLLALPLFGLWGKIGLITSGLRCDILPISDDYLDPKKFFYSLFFLLPLIIMTTCYVGIFIKVRRMKKQLLAYISSHKEEDWQVLKMMSIIFICYIFGALPIFITNLIDPLRLQVGLHVVPRMLISVQALINPFIYAFNNKVYQKAFRKLYRDVLRIVCS